MIGRGALLAKNVLKTNIRNYSGSGVGSNLPFSIGNSPKLTLAFILFFAPPFWAPWFITRYQMLKK